MQTIPLINLIFYLHGLKIPFILQA